MKIPLFRAHDTFAKYLKVNTNFNPKWTLYTIGLKDLILSIPKGVLYCIVLKKCI